MFWTFCVISPFVLPRRNQITNVWNKCSKLKNLNFWLTTPLTYNETSRKHFNFTFHKVWIKGKNSYTHPVCIIVQYNQVSVADVESRKVITGIFGIKDVFIYNIGCSSCFWCVPTKTIREQSVSLQKETWLIAHDQYFSPSGMYYSM